MKFRVLLFAAARQVAGDSVEVEVDAPATAAAIAEALIAAQPTLEPLVRHGRLAVDSAYVDPNATIPDDAEVALIPPVSGG